MAKSFPKINDAIENAFEALQKANRSDENSNVALIKAKSTEAQFNAVVRRETDSNAETAQMRVDLDNIEHPTANARLEADLNKVIQKFDENAYYHGVQTTKRRDSVSNTDYYITRIPYRDDDGNIIKIKRGFAKDVPNGGVTETAREFANRHNATLTVNASVFDTTTFKPIGVDIYNGVVLNEGVFPNRYIIGIKSDNTLISYPPETSAKSILADGCENALAGFTPLISNGQKVSDTILQAYSSSNAPHPRQTIAQMPNKDILFLTCDGRTAQDIGMTCYDVQRLLMEEGVQYAHMLDGGGSTQTVVRGRLINKSIDNNGYLERFVPDFLYFAKEAKYNRDRDIAVANADIGELAKKVADFMLDVQNKTDMNQGYMRLMGPAGYTSQGIEAWEGNNRYAKLYMQKDSIQYYDVLNSINIFRVLTDGSILTKKGTVGEFMTETTAPSSLNSITKNGFYWATASTGNVPDTNSSWGVIHFQANNETALQFAIGFNQTSTLKKRRKVSGAWEGWNNA